MTDSILNEATVRKIITEEIRKCIAVSEKNMKNYTDKKIEAIKK